MTSTEEAADFSHRTKLLMLVPSMLTALESARDWMREEKRQHHVDFHNPALEAVEKVLSKAKEPA